MGHTGRAANQETSLVRFAKPSIFNVPMNDVFDCLDGIELVMRRGCRTSKMIYF